MIEVQLEDGSTRRLWCTFGPQQIDINPFSEPGLSLLRFGSLLCRFLASRCIYRLLLALMDPGPAWQGRSLCATPWRGSATGASALRTMLDHWSMGNHARGTLHICMQRRLFSQLARVQHVSHQKPRPAALPVALRCRPPSGSIRAGCWRLLLRGLVHWCSGAKIVRLDAFGYVTKEPGTRCFFQEPEVWKLLDMVEKIVHEKDTGCAGFALCLNPSRDVEQDLGY